MDEKINIGKNVYSNLQFKKIIDTNFSELTSKKEDLDIDKFFSDYNDLYLELPINGEQSHETLFRRSGQLLGEVDDPRDLQIQSLLQTIEDLQLQILEGQQGGEQEIRHPQFDNGTLLKDVEGGGVYLMAKGKKRKVVGGNIKKVLIQLQPGGKIDTPINDVAILVPPSILNGIENGPRLNDTNFNLSDSTIDDKIQDQIFNIDWADSTLDLEYARSVYSFEEYLAVLEDDILAKYKVIDFVEKEINNRLTQINFLRKSNDPDAQEKTNILVRERNDLSITLEGVENKLQKVKEAFDSLTLNPNQWLTEQTTPDEPVNLDNPLIKYNVLKDNLKIMFKSGYLRNNKINGPEKDLRQARDKERNGSTERKASQWRNDIDKRSSSNDQKDLFDVLNKTVERYRQTGGDSTLLPNNI